MLLALHITGTMVLPLWVITLPLWIVPAAIVALVFIATGAMLVVLVLGMLMLWFMEVQSNKKVATSIKRDKWADVDSTPDFVGDREHF